MSRADDVAGDEHPLEGGQGDDVDEAQVEGRREMSEHRPSDERGGDDSGFFDDAPVEQDADPEAEDEATDADRERLTGERAPGTEPFTHP